MNEINELYRKTLFTDGEAGDSRTCRKPIAMSELLPRGSILVVFRACVDFTLFES